MVIKCSGGIWLSVEKHDTGIYVRIGRDKPNVIKFKGYNEQRINPKLLCQQKAKSGRSGQDLFLWIINEQLPKPYNLAESNCQHFCFDVTQQFVDGDNPLPGRLALTVKNLIENKYRGGTSDA